jgi:hypothetical protein
MECMAWGKGWGDMVSTGPEYERPKDAMMKCGVEGG